MIKIIFRIIAIFTFAYVIADGIKSFCKSREGPSEENSDSNEDLIPYDVLDDIVSLRKQLQNIEDLISDLESFRDDPYQQKVKVNFADASGKYGFQATGSEELLKYLYSERDNLRRQITVKIRTFC